MRATETKRQIWPEPVFWRVMETIRSKPAIQRGKQLKLLMMAKTAILHCELELLQSPLEATIWPQSEREDRENSIARSTLT